MSEFDYKKHWAFDGLTSKDENDSAPETDEILKKVHEVENSVLKLNIKGAKSKFVYIDIDYHDDMLIKTEIF
ncbi:MAG: hypothetical protein IJD40_11250 [Lachnospiraceae bacterium]|nr:hypothetical protein [Lachnospiraceae bacterium]